MSNLERIENLKQIVVRSQQNFDELAKIHNAVNFKKEASFAIQILEGNEYLAGVAMKNPDSLKHAVINVAAIGLSLSPVFKLAYLVPRDSKVCLDISYQGLMNLGIECGAIKFCQAGIVMEKDDYENRGFDKEPVHTFKRFSKDRGPIVGGYCTAKTPDGDFITIEMDIEEIYKIRNRSEAYKRKSGPWVSDESEMIKKTLIRRAYKSWPKKQNEQSERLAKAMSLEEETEAIETTSTPVEESVREKGLAELRAGLTFLKREEEKYIEYLITFLKRDIKKIEDMTDIELAKQLIWIKQLSELQKERNTKIEAEKAKQKTETTVEKEVLADIDTQLGLKIENTSANK